MLKNGEAVTADVVEKLADILAVAPMVNAQGCGPVPPPEHTLAPSVPPTQLMLLPPVGVAVRLTNEPKLYTPVHVPPPELQFRICPSKEEIEPVPEPVGVTVSAAVTVPVGEPKVTWAVAQPLSKIDNSMKFLIIAICSSSPSGGGTAKIICFSNVSSAARHASGLNKLQASLAQGYWNVSVCSQRVKTKIVRVECHCYWTFGAVTILCHNDAVFAHRFSVRSGGRVKQ